MEHFKDIPGYEGLYQVSNRGRVLSFVKQKMLKPHLHLYGYMTMCLADLKGGRKYKKIHRLVLAAFRGESKLMVNHVNHVRHDNNLSNLEYCTALENMQHCVRAGRNVNPPKKKCQIPHDVVRAIRKSNESYRVLMSRYSIGQTHVYRIRNREYYADVSDD